MGRVDNCSVEYIGLFLFAIQRDQFNSFTTSTLHPTIRNTSHLPNTPYSIVTITDQTILLLINLLSSPFHLIHYHSVSNKASLSHLLSTQHHINNTSESFTSSLVFLSATLPRSTGCTAPFHLFHLYQRTSPYSLLAALPDLRVFFCAGSLPCT